jgi:hypothetical protein
MSVNEPYDNWLRMRRCETPRPDFPDRILAALHQEQALKQTSAVKRFLVLAWIARHRRVFLFSAAGAALVLRVIGALSVFFPY